jgi:adenylate cyclase
MGIEIERKFLVVGSEWRSEAIASKPMKQGYLGGLGRASVRVRTTEDAGYLNIKSAELGISRREYEYAIPLAEAEEMLEGLAEGAVIDKTRYIVPVGDHTWEIDVFAGANAGLVVAEVELATPDEDFERPAWLGKEVSDDPRYYNVCLVTHPYSDW